MAPRRSQSPEGDAADGTSKRPRLSPSATDSAEDLTTPAPDSLIDHEAAIRYWSSTPATVAGVLGGYPALSRTDLQGSANFLAKLRGGKKDKLALVADCGAGIGRITLGFLGKVADKVDVVEPVEQFCDVVRKGDEFEAFRGTVWQVGLEDWAPDETRKYQLIWNQWCLGQLTDEQLAAYLERSKGWITAGGWIVVKENLSNHPAGLDIFDETDSSVTRTKTKFEDIFAKAGLKVARTELQRGFPKELYPVRIWGLQPV